MLSTQFFLFLFVSDNIESDFFRKVKDKRPSAGSTSGQILPVISDKSSHVTQVQGSRRDQIGNMSIKQCCVAERFAHCLQAVITFAILLYNTCPSWPCSSNSLKLVILYAFKCSNCYCFCGHGQCFSQRVSRFLLLVGQVASLIVRI